MNNFPAMTAAQRQEMVNWLEEGIACRDEYGFSGNVLKSMQIALAALTAPPAPVLRVPAGWKLVPMVATDEMIEAHLDEQILRGDETGISLENPSDCYRAMINAAPEASNEQ